MSVRGVQYVRMSTEHQRYSTENQSDVIRQYAAAYRKVAEHADELKG